MLVAEGRDGATTVTTTMIIAHMAGISVFATGGIGGVHRGAETTMDISADLEELGQTPVTVSYTHLDVYKRQARVTRHP